jgi:F1F0 ATPase subunit 2
MHEAMVLAGMAGLMLGAVFFGGLWWTVRRGVSSPQPALWFFGSLILRLAVASAGFYLAAGGHWERMLSCLFGFASASLIVTRLTRAFGGASSRAEQEVGRAPDS